MVSLLNLVTALISAAACQDAPTAADSGARGAGAGSIAAAIPANAPTVLVADPDGASATSAGPTYTTAIGIEEATGRVDRIDTTAVLYPHPTLVEVIASGRTIRTHHPSDPNNPDYVRRTPGPENFGPEGDYFFQSCFASVSVGSRLLDSTSSFYGKTFTCPWVGSTPTPTTVSAHAVLHGNVWVTRSKAYNPCDYVCYTIHSGGQTVTITPVPVTATLSASRTVVAPGDTTRFSLALSPRVVGGVLAPYRRTGPDYEKFYPDTGGSLSGCTISSVPSTAPGSCRYTAHVSGTMEFNVIVSGTVMKLRQRIEVPPREFKVTVDKASVATGDTVTATALGGPSGSPWWVDRWTFRNATTQAVTALPCNSATTCRRPATQTGWFIASGKVAGQTMRDSAFVQVAPKLAVACAPSTVTRGDSISCSLMPTPANGQLATSYWGYITDDANIGTIARPDGTLLTHWRGRVVVSGRVRVEGVLNGVAVAAETTVTVLPRDWANRQPTFLAINIGQGPLPPDPRADADLGQVAYSQRADSNEHWREIPEGGPNGLLAYMIEVHEERSLVALNVESLRDGSNFWLAHPVTPTAGGHCPRSFLTGTLPGLILAHEGMQFESGSHTQRYRDALLAERVGPIVERIITSGGINGTIVRTRMGAAYTRAADAGRLADVENPVLLPNCSLNYSY
jgi:hypothetical protein